MDIDIKRELDSLKKRQGGQRGLRETKCNSVTKKLMDLDKTFANGILSVSVLSITSISPSHQE